MLFREFRDPRNHLLIGFGGRIVLAFRDVIGLGTQRAMLRPVTRQSAGGQWTIRRDHLLAGSCCNDHLLPSGSLKKTNDPQGITSISLTATPRLTSSSRTAFTSVTTICRPLSEPGAMSVIPTPITIEQAEPGGVSWTNRRSSLTLWS